MTFVMALLGALCGAGALGVVAAVRGTDPADARPRRPSSAPAFTDRVERLSLRLALGVGAGVVIGMITRWPVAALLLGLAGYMVPSITGGREAREAAIARIEAIATWAEMLRDTMAGAGGLEQSIIACAGVAPAAIRTEVRHLAARLERERLTVALREFADEIDDPTGDLVVAALLLAADKNPKRLGALLGMLAQSARAEVEMRLRVETGRARTRASVKVISVATVLFATGLTVLNREYLEPYNSLFGQLMMLVVGLCFATSFLWLAHASRLPGNERFLSATGADL